MNEMKILLIGQADSIFFEHYTKTIIAIKPEVSFDIFSIDAINGKYDLSACNKIYVNKWEKSLLSKIKGLRRILQPFYTYSSLWRFLKSNNKTYDIIHIKWLVPGVIICPGMLKRYSKRIIGTFWGGELERQEIFLVIQLYKIFLKNFLNNIDAITLATDERKRYIEKLTNTKCYIAKYGSSILSQLEEFYNRGESKIESKVKLGIDSALTTVAIGYSGKSIHRHVPIINELFNDPKFLENSDKFHFILQMNYGCGSDYVYKVKEIISKYTNKFTILYPGKYTDEEIARVRNATDVLIQLSSTDGLSSSIIESFYAGTIIIAGSWLPYGIFKKSGLHFYELDNIDKNLPDLLLRILLNIENELKICSSNRKKYEYNLWEHAIKSWINIYDILLNNV